MYMFGNLEELMRFTGHTHAHTHIRIYVYKYYKVAYYNIEAESQLTNVFIRIIVTAIHDRLPIIHIIRIHYVICMYIRHHTKIIILYTGTYTLKLLYFDRLVQ